MTKEHGAGGGATLPLVNSTSSTDIKHILGRSSDRCVAGRIKEAILMKEEDKMMDEEITSVESGDRIDAVDDHENVEQAMLSVAIMNSVVEVHDDKIFDRSTVIGHGNGLSDDATSALCPNRYGLRQRRNASGDDVQQLENVTKGTNHLSNPLPVGHTKSASTKRRPGPNPSTIPSSKAATATTKTIRPPRPSKLKRPRPGSNNGTCTVDISGFKENPTADLPTSSFFNVNSSVPNPLSVQLDTPLSIPNTILPKPTHDNIHNYNISTTTNTGTKARGHVVPCPIPSESEANNATNHPVLPVSNVDTMNDVIDQKQRVTFSEPMGTRDRGFSIDLDLALDFGEEQSASEVNELNILSGGGRNRAYSFECFAFGINSDEPLPPLEASVPTTENLGVVSGYEEITNETVQCGRPRGDSIVFEQLRPRADSIVLDHPGRPRIDSICFEQHTTRPRGDSIIFDPSSFQDGGIHEQRALEQATSSVTLDQVDNLVDTLLQGVVTDPEPPKNQLVVPSPVPSSTVIHTPLPSNARKVANTIPSSTPVEATQLSPSNPMLACNNLPYDILNKDGRIGIYLPDARRDRIARFHAKRSKRIWRKRIKYDCRKKLADSRPRIKGRFVKRSDD